MNRVGANRRIVPSCDGLCVQFSGDGLRVQFSGNGLASRTILVVVIVGVLWLISASTVAAQVTIVQTPSVACSNVSSCTIVFPQAVQAADAIWIVTDFAGTSLQSVVDTLSSQYSILGSVTTSPDKSWQQIAAWAQPTAAGSLSVTVSLTGTSPFVEMYAFDLRGAMIDTHTSASGVAGNVSVPISVTTANEVAVATIISGGTAKAGSGFTLASNLHNNLAEWTQVPNAGTANITASSNAVWAMSAATFRQSSTVIAPSITTQPSNQTVTSGQTATFSVAAAGSAPLKYQWQKNGGSITSATSSSYTTPVTTTADSGSTFRVVVTNTAGSIKSSAATLTVNPGPAAALTVGGFPNPTTAGAAGNLTVTAKDALGNTATGYRGMMHFTSSDASAILPADYTFVAGDNGVHVFAGVVLKTAGVQSLTGTDTVTATITGTEAGIVVNPAPVAPTITTQPASRVVTAGQTATFAVAAIGTAPLHYQWYENSAAISLANSTSYTTPATSSSDDGSVFQVVVSNSAGSVTSNSATLTVVSGGSIATATVNASSPGLVIRANFGGIIVSNIQGVNDLMGTAAAPNPIYRQLIKNLMFPGQQFIISTEDDQGETAAPTATQVSALGQLYIDLKNSGFTIGLYPGIPMCPNSTTLATSYATTWINDLPSGSMQGMVIGNEPDGPCKEGTYADFLSKFQTWTSDINALPGGAGVKFMGPQFGGQLPWQFTGADLNPFINSESSVLGVVGQHWYPLTGNVPCRGGNASIPALLSTSAATSASSIISSYVKNAHSKGLTFRISEMNSADCSGVQGVSDTFASALWVVDGLFHLANVDVDGVNIFTDEGDAYDLFGFTTTSAPYHISFVAPEYYGTLVFQQATQNGAKLLPVTLTTSSNISVWATVDSSNTVRVLVINKDQSASGDVSITLTGFGNGTLSKLVAPSVSSKTGVTWAGQTFDGSSDGTIQGTESSTTVMPNSNVYTFSIAPTSAALLTVCNINSGCGSPGSGGGGNPPTVPSITAHPSNQTVTVGQTATFSVAATGAWPLTYQWQKGTSNILNATFSSYTTPPTTSADDGDAFRVIVTNSAGNATSNPATLTVNSQPPPPSTANILTYHNDNARTGQNLGETTLTTANVNSTTFGRLGFLPVDGLVDAEPLYVSNLTVAGTSRNVVFVATEHDSVYAFDADTFAQLWKVTLLGIAETASDVRNCDQVAPEIGITSTPVIDLKAGTSGTIFVVAMSKKGSSYFQRLHALNLTTGAEQTGSPTTIQATFTRPVTGGQVNFDPKQYKERAALLLLNGVIYTTWASHCDILPYQGWIMGYSESTLQQTSVLNITPNGSLGAIWGSGAGPSADSAGNFYFLAGNGTFDTLDVTTGFPVNGDFGNGFLKLSTTNNNLAVADYFNMHDTNSESAVDEDLGSGGSMILPDLKDNTGKTWHLAVGAGKDGRIYVVNRDNMGKFNQSNNNAIYQELDGALPGGVWSTSAYFNNTVYYGPVGSTLRAFTISNAKLPTSPSSQSAHSFGYPGATPSISGNGALNGIVWAIENGGTGVLHAYDATNLGKELYNSNQAGTRDKFSTTSNCKYVTPMIANGKVFVGTATGVVVFGLL
jgi:hypothetical protein